MMVTQKERKTITLEKKLNILQSISIQITVVTHDTYVINSKMYIHSTLNYSTCYGLIYTLSGITIWIISQYCLLQYNIVI
jgi:hypothetical protein